MEYLKSGKIYFEKAVHKIKSEPKIILSNILAFVFSFILSHAQFSSGISPLGCAVCASVPTEFFFSCFLGQVFGCAVKLNVINTLRYVISSAIIKLLLYKISKIKTEYEKIWFITPLCVFSVLLSSGLTVGIFNSLNLKNFFIILFESAATGVCSYFFSRSSEFSDIKDASLISSRQFVYLVFSSGAFLSAFSSFNLYNVSLSKILVGFLVLLFAYCGNELSSCVAGVVGGISVGIYSKSSFDIISMSLSGLVTGVFSPLGIGGCVSAFTLCRMASFFFSDSRTGLFPTLCECTLSVIFFLAVPKNFSLDLSEMFLPSERTITGFDTKREISEKMIKASDCLNEISESVEKVSDRLSLLAESNTKAIYCKVQSEICENCEKKSYCLDKNYKQTYQYFEQISKVFSTGEKISEEDLPVKFAVLCKHREDFLTCFEKHYKRHKEFMFKEMQTQNLRNGLRDQLNCAVKALKKFSSDINCESAHDTKTAVEVKNILGKYGVKVQNVNCVLSEKGVMKIKALCKSFDSDMNKQLLLKDLEDLTLRKFEMPKVSFLEKGITFEIEQKPWIKVNTGLCRIPARSSSLCGDQCDFFTENGVLSVIISDGMGTGGRAAVDSAMSAEYFKKLIKNGFSEDVALKIVNDCMLVKSSYESLSTLDYAKIDLFTGKTQLFKAGAAATLIKKDDRFIVCEDASLPIGILREIEFIKEDFSLSPCDIIVMMSDGATSCGTEWIKEIVEDFNRKNAEDLARDIALKAVEKNRSEKQDDVTVFAAILS